LAAFLRSTTARKKGVFTMIALKEMLEQRAELAGKIYELRDKAELADGWTTEDRTAWDSVNADYDKLAEKIEIESRTEQLRRDTAERQFEGRVSEEAEDSRAVALNAWFRASMGEEPTERERGAAAELGLNLHSRYLNLNLANTAPQVDVEDRDAIRPSRRAFRDAVNGSVAEMRDMTVGTATSGADFVPAGFVTQLEQAALYFGPMLQTSEILRTPDGRPMDWPTSTDTGNTGELLAESVAAAEADPTTGTVVFNAYKYSSKAVIVPVELMEDSGFNMPNYLAGIIGERLGRIQNTHYTTGTGSAQPNGIVTASSLGVTAAATGAITTDELIDLQDSVDSAYQNGAAFMSRQATISAVRKLKDGNSDYLWASGLKDNRPDQLLGQTLWTNNDIAAMATGVKSFIYGQLSKYKVRQVRQIRIRRLVERWADQDQEGWIAFMRGDGDLVDAAGGSVKHLIQA
jgi:HK97 family phage major capsid protein